MYQESEDNKMGFSNEYLTDEEKELIAQTRHMRLTSTNKTESFCLVNRATVDREQKIWLVDNATTYDWDPRVRGKLFVVFWGKIHRDNVIEVTLKDLGWEEDEFVKEKYAAVDIRYWELMDIKISKQLQIHKYEIKAMLGTIMNAYGISGNPRHNGYDFGGEIKAIIKEYRV